MPGAIPAHVQPHTAIPLLYTESADPNEWTEGEPDAEASSEPEHGLPFACVLFLPGPGGDQPNQYRPRAVKVPSLLFNPTRSIAHAAFAGAPAVIADGSAIKLGKESELLVAAPELAAFTGGELVRWQVDGIPQGFGRPGSVLGVLAQLRRVDD